ncbi:LysR family transcriptional regulator [Paenalcaligenes niemegkensis]|uniref:LysR family transcriptional regulator n=1 Tax=Paenalcaligenes niemegkensis TaxID=2895469 RepID=UPI001EE90A1C|nr:LysR family transcriptional regulator [Paenalcaligenes niemegkensis]MCQ9616038.1 LysR family transcriptional regulator [Paenalcaligenes niemegkensis]
MLINVRDLDLRLIRVFLAIVDANGISAAQDRLNVSQSTISTQLGTLETRLGFRLCERGRAGFKLTAKGERFAKSARRLLGTLDEFAIESQNLEKRLIGQLNVGFIGHLPRSGSRRLSRAVSLFRQRDEAVRLSVSVLSPDQLEEMLINGQLHMAIGYFWRRAQHLRYAPLLIEKQIAYCGYGHALYERAGDIGFDEALRYPWVSRGYVPPKNHLRVPPQNIRALANNMDAAAVLIQSGEHLGYLPEEIGNSYVQRGEMRALNPRGLSYEVTLHTVVNRASEKDEALMAFMQDLKKADRGKTTPQSRGVERKS